MPQLEHFKRSEDLEWEKAWSVFDRDGGFIVEDFIAPDLLGFGATPAPAGGAGFSRQVEALRGTLTG